MPVRRTTRSLIRRLWRHLTRSPAGREPNPLAQMVACHRRAIRAYRRLARLAPRHYDPTVRRREARQREEDRKWRATWQPALEKVYGPHSPEQREAERKAEWLDAQPPPLHPNTQRAVDRQLAAYQLWKEAGRAAFARYEDFQRRHPHQLMPISRLCQLTEIAFDFAWIASGWDWRNPKPAPPPERNREEEVAAAIARAYPTPQVQSSDEAFETADAGGCPPAQPATTNHQPVPPAPEPSTINPQPIAASLPQLSTINDQPTTEGPRPRRDAYASLARHQRALARSRHSNR